METWEQCKTKVATSIENLLNTSNADAYEMLERVHRSAPNPNYKGSAPRPIFAALYCWPDAERLVEESRKSNISGESTTSFDYKYGPLTTKRRQLAFKERKLLKDNGTIVSGYIAYPARLFVKTSKRQGSKYTLLKDFSHEKVTFGKRE